LVVLVAPGLAALLAVAYAAGVLNAPLVALVLLPLPLEAVTVTV